MSPEVLTAARNIEDNAHNITDLLLKIEAKADQASVVTLDQELESSTELAKIRKLMSFPAEQADVSDLVDTRIEEITPVISPYSLEKALPISADSAKTTRQSRLTIENILTGKDDRLIVIVGPCSIDDPETALEYADWLIGMKKLYGETLEIVMRAYFEKPRTELGWKGIVNDPDRDNSCNTNLGVVKSRMLALEITKLGMSLATERLNALTPQFFSGLIAYDAVGANNSSDQKAREYGSGTSSSVGYKNTKEGNVEVAAEAVVTTLAPHVFIGMNDRGKISEVRTGIMKNNKKIGNEYAHIILRGGKNGPNYSAKHVKKALAILEKKELPQIVIIDASHENSRSPQTGEKDHNLQLEVILDIKNQLSLGQTAIKGVMIESHLKAGKQKFVAGETDVTTLEKGVSITDACADLKQTQQMLALLHGGVLIRRFAARE